MKRKIIAYLKLFAFIAVSTFFLVPLRAVLRQISRPASQNLDVNHELRKNPPTADSSAAPVLPMAETKPNAPFVRWMDSLEPGPWFKKLLAFPGIPYLLAVCFVVFVYWLSLLMAGLFKKNVCPDGQKAHFLNY